MAWIVGILFGRSPLPASTWCFSVVNRRSSIVNSSLCLCVSVVKSELGISAVAQDVLPSAVGQLINPETFDLRRTRAFAPQEHLPRAQPQLHKRFASLEHLGRVGKLRAIPQI